MLRSLTIFAFAMSVQSATAQGMSTEACDTTAGIVNEAQALRVDGNNEKRAARKLNKQFSDLGDAYTEKVIPVLINFVYMQPEIVLDQDLAAAWRETCLNTDLSSVLPSE